MDRNPRAERLDLHGGVQRLLSLCDTSLRCQHLHHPLHCLVLTTEPTWGLLPRQETPGPLSRRRVLPLAQATRRYNQRGRVEEDSRVSSARAFNGSAGATGRPGLFATRLDADSRRPVAAPNDGTPTQNTRLRAQSAMPCPPLVAEIRRIFRLRVPRSSALPRHLVTGLQPCSASSRCLSASMSSLSTETFVVLTPMPFSART